MDLRPFIGLPDTTKNVDPHLHGYPSYMERAFEREQLDTCIKATAETADYLYTRYTPARVKYQPGTRPLLEAIVKQVCADCKTDRERAIALVRWRRANYRHLGKCGLGSEEEIILGGYSMCHDASRTLITLNQVAGMGARMILALNEETGHGHTLTEVFVDGRWAIMDPSPGIPHPYYELEDGRLANAWDIHEDPTIPQRCQPDFENAALTRQVGTYFRDYRLVNYSLEDSTRNMANRFLRLVAAMKIVENYDYVGHMNHAPLSSYTDLDQIVQQWLAGTIPVWKEHEAKREATAPVG